MAWMAGVSAGVAHTDISAGSGSAASEAEVERKPPESICSSPGGLAPRERLGFDPILVRGRSHGPLIVNYNVFRDLRSYSPVRAPESPKGPHRQSLFCGLCT